VSDASVLGRLQTALVLLERAAGMSPERRSVDGRRLVFRAGCLRPAESASLRWRQPLAAPCKQDEALSAASRPAEVLAREALQGALLPLPLARWERPQQVRPALLELPSQA